MSCNKNRNLNLKKQYQTKFSSPKIIFITFLQKERKFSLQKTFYILFFRRTKLLAEKNRHFRPTFYCPIKVLTLHWWINFYKYECWVGLKVFYKNGDRVGWFQPMTSLDWRATSLSYKISEYQNLINGVWILSKKNLRWGGLSNLYIP